MRYPVLIIPPPIYNLGRTFGANKLANIQKPEGIEIKQFSERYITSSGSTFVPDGKGLVLLRFDYRKLMQSQPRYGQFGAQTSLDALDITKKYLNTLYQEYYKREFPKDLIHLALPELVVQVEKEFADDLIKAEVSKSFNRRMKNKYGIDTNLSAD